jgi:hypothetical protein
VSYGKATLQAGTKSVVQPKAAGTGEKAPGGLDVTAFEISCYLANYRESGE